MRLLRLRADREARRGRHRDAGSHPAPVEGDPDRPREVHLPGLRADHAASGALPSDLTRLGGPEPAGDGSVREVRPAPAAQPAGRALCREGVELSLSTLADQVGACTVALAPLHALIEAHVLAAERLHGDDTPVPVLARGKTDKGRLGSMSATTAVRRRRTARGAVQVLPRSPWRAPGAAPRTVGRRAPGRSRMRASARSMLAIARRDR